MVFKSAKSTLISPGLIIKSIIAFTPSLKTSSICQNAFFREVSREIRLKIRSLEIVIKESQD